MFPIIAYASRTGTRRNLEALRLAEWRLIVSAAGVLRTEGFRYALDNGAWSAFTQGRVFDERQFSRALNLLGRDADWVVVPDIVAGGKRSLDLSFSWLARVMDATTRALIAVQDGILETDIRDFLGFSVGIFVGGSTEFKLNTLSRWAWLGFERGCWVHVGRVNSAKRIRLCKKAGVTSFDGSSASKFAVTLPDLNNARYERD